MSRSGSAKRTSPHPTCCAQCSACVMEAGVNLLASLGVVRRPEIVVVVRRVGTRISCRNLVDAIDAAPRHREDEMLLALIRLAQTGHQLAGRVVLQAMMPKLGKITIRTNGSSPSADNAWSEDRRHIAVAEFWDVLVSYPAGRRTTKVAANLALDTLHRLTAGTRGAQLDLPIDPSEFALTHTRSESPSTYELDEAATAGELTTDADLVQVITWGVTHQDSWPLRLAAVEAGKWGCGRPGRRFHCDAYELVHQDGVGDHRQELSIVA